MGTCLYFFKITVSSGVSLCLQFLLILSNFKITDHNEKLVVSHKSLSLKSVDQKQPRRGVL